jgi:hypothetical protein
MKYLFLALCMGMTSMICAQQDTTLSNELSSVDSTEVQSSTHQWEQLAARYEVLAEGFGQDMALTLSIRMRRDSIVWFSVQAALGIQVAKGMLRKDSFFLLDLYNRKYYNMPAKRMQELLGFSLPLKALQELLMNQESAFGPCLCMSYEEEAQGVATQISAKYHGLNVSYSPGTISDCNWEDSSLVYRGRSAMWKGENESRTLLHCASVNDPAESWRLTWAYDEFTEGDGMNMPQFIRLLGGETKASAQNIIQASMRLKTARFTPIPSYPFAVPEGYEYVEY